jgi:predicted nucleotidyltransferase
MIVADLGLAKPRTYGELGVVLREKGVLSEQGTELIKEVVAARNAVAHAYRGMESGDLVELATNLLPKVEDLCRLLMDYVRKSNLDPGTAFPHKCKEVFERNQVKLAYLFGSGARGVGGCGSDYDFAVLLGRRTTVRDEIKLALDLAKALDVPVDEVDVVTLDAADPELIYRILREGRLVYASSDEERRRWERHALIETLDLRDFYEFQMGSSSAA